MRVLVVMPTYDEAENLDRVLTSLHASHPDIDVLVVDDASPDGTGRIADALATADDRVHVMHRPGKHGLGAAYRAGFAWGLDREYDHIVEMDADGSHRPDDLGPHASSGHGRCGPRDRLPLDRRRTGRQLAVAPPVPLTWRHGVRAPHARLPRRTTALRASACSDEPPSRGSTSTPSTPTAIASRST